MEFKIDTKKRIKILNTKLSEIKETNQHFNEEIWYSTFIRKFAAESGLKYTSVRNRWSYRETYYFKIEDKNKYMLAKIKYGL